MNEELTQQVKTRYEGLISAISNNAIEKTEGVTKEVGLVKYRFGLSTLKDRNVHVYIDNNNTVMIDIYVNVDFGYSVPDVVCNLQECIKREVESNTRFVVDKINVFVSNINFN